MTVFVQLRTGIQAELKVSPAGEVDVLNWMGRTALELIGQGGFGHSFDPLFENIPNNYADVVKGLMYVCSSPYILGLVLIVPLAQHCHVSPSSAW